jgi:hypothetical protein
LTPGELGFFAFRAPYYKHNLILTL